MAITPEQIADSSFNDPCESCKHHIGTAGDEWPCNNCIHMMIDMWEPREKTNVKSIL